MATSIDCGSSKLLLDFSYLLDDNYFSPTIRQFRIVSVPNVYGVAAASWSVGIAIPSSLLSR